jgi:Flp pilus assembly pilin Flp
MSNYAVIASAIALAVVSTTSAVMINVDSSQFFNQTGIQATGGEKFSITASGTVNIAEFDGPYDADPNGVITLAPPVGSGAYNFFTFNAGPVGIPPAVGDTKSILPGFSAQLVGAPYAALVAGFSLSPSPTSFGDFPNGFQLVGSSAIITTPVGGGFLFLAVNDINNTTDNVGSFTAQVTQVTSVPESGSTLSLMLLGFGLLAAAHFRFALARAALRIHSRATS